MMKVTFEVLAVLGVVGSLITVGLLIFERRRLRFELERIHYHLSNQESRLPALVEGLSRELASSGARADEGVAAFDRRGRVTAIGGHVAADLIQQTREIIGVVRVASSVSLSSEDPVFLAVTGRDGGFAHLPALASEFRGLVQASAAAVADRDALGLAGEDLRLVLASQGSVHLLFEVARSTYHVVLSDPVQFVLGLQAILSLTRRSGDVSQPVPPDTQLVRLEAERLESIVRSAHEGRDKGDVLVIDVDLAAGRATIVQVPLDAIVKADRAAVALEALRLAACNAESAPKFRADNSAEGTPATGN